MKKPRIAVLGAGLVGQRHVALVRQHAELAAIVDPSETAKQTADKIGAAWFSDLTDFLTADRPDGVIIATPNQMHVDHGLECLAAGLPILVEKPVADTSASAERLVMSADQAGVPVLVGHHRRYNPLIGTAKDAIQGGQLGNVVAVNAQCWLYKPDDYFDVDWRKKTGAGPVFINLIHDIDLLRFLCGEIVAVQARESSLARGNEVEDTAVILLDFANGALGTVSVSDTIAAPWSWELTAAENPAYPVTGSFCYTIGGDAGSLSIPDLQLWQYPDRKGWWDRLEQIALSHAPEDPLVLQLRHFCDVIAGRAEPLVSGREGLETLRVIEAIKQAARSGVVVRL